MLDSSKATHGWGAGPHITCSALASAGSAYRECKTGRTRSVPRRGEGLAYLLCAFYWAHFLFSLILHPILPGRCLSVDVNHPPPTGTHILSLIPVSFSSRDFKGGGPGSAFQVQRQLPSLRLTIAWSLVRLPTWLLDPNVSEASQSLWIEPQLHPKPKACLSTVVATWFQSCCFPCSRSRLCSLPTPPSPQHTASHQVLMALFLNFSEPISDPFFPFPVPLHLTSHHRYKWFAGYGLQFAS